MSAAKNPPPTPSSRPRWNPPQAPTSEGSRKAAAQTPFPPPNNNQIQITTQTKIQIDELLLAFVSRGEKWYPYPCGLIRWFWAIFFQDVEHFKMEAGILNFSQVVKGSARSSKGICLYSCISKSYSMLYFYIPASGGIDSDFSKSA